MQSAEGNHIIQTESPAQEWRDELSPIKWIEANNQTIYLKTTYQHSD